MDRERTEPASGAAPSKWRLRLKYLLFALIPVTVLFVIAEILAGVTIARRARVTESETGQRTYVMTIGGWSWSRRSVTPLNADGLPDIEFDSVPPRGECALAVLSGDSFAFGDGVDRDSNFVEILKRISAARTGGRCVRFFNVSERGTTIDRQSGRILQAIDRLHPDVVILAQYQNDLTDLIGPVEEGWTGQVTLAPTPPPAPDDSSRPSAGPIAAATGRAAPVWERLGIFNPRIVRFLSYHVFGWMLQNGVRYDALRHWSVLADSGRAQEAARLVGIYETYYDSLAVELQRRGVAFATFSLPSKFDVLAGRVPEEALFARLAQKYGHPHISLFPAFDAHRDPYPFLVYDGHLNETGNRLVADALAAWLFTDAAAPFPQFRQGAPTPTAPR